MKLSVYKNIRQKLTGQIIIFVNLKKEFALLTINSIKKAVLRTALNTSYFIFPIRKQRIPTGQQFLLNNHIRCHTMKLL